MNRLISLGLDVHPLNDTVNTNISDTVSLLNINNLSIYDLTGIEDFTNLQTLNEINSVFINRFIRKPSLSQSKSQFNSLTGNLDLSNNQAEYVKVRSNQLSSIVLENDTTIEYLNLMDNQFSQLSLDNLTSLRNLIITNNKY